MSENLAVPFDPYTTPLPPGALTAEELDAAFPPLTPEQQALEDEREAQYQEWLQVQSSLPEAYAQTPMGCEAACIAFIDSYLGTRVTRPEDIDAITGRLPGKPQILPLANLWLLDQ